MTAPKPSRTGRIDFRVNADPVLKPFLMPRLKDQGSGEEVTNLARETLALHARLSDRAVRSLKFSENEVKLMLDAVNGWFVSPDSAMYLASEVEDALHDGLTGKWNVDGSALVARLKALHPFDAAALAYALRAAWDTYEAHGHDVFAAARTLGLMPADTNDAGRNL